MSWAYFIIFTFICNGLDQPNKGSGHNSPNLTKVDNSTRSFFLFPHSTRAFLKNVASSRPMLLRRSLSLSAAIAGVSSTLNHRQITQLHQHLICSNLLSPFHATKLLHLYSSTHDLHSSLHLFSSLPFPPSVFAWTSLLTLLNRLHLHRECLCNYFQLRYSEISPDRFIFPPVLRSAQFLNFPISSLHCECIKFGTESSLPVSNALISAYAKSDDITGARKLFDVMLNKNLLSYNSMISAYSSIKLIDPALKLLSSMKSDGIQPDIVTQNTLINGFCQAGRFEEAISLLENLPNPNIVSWTALISALARRTDHDAALNLFRKMVFQNRIKPDSDILSCVISSCRYISALKTAREIHSYGLKTLDLDLFYCSAGPALVTTYASCQKISAVKSIFNFMNLTDLVSWNAILAAFVQLKLHDLVISYFKQMQLRGIYIDETTIVTILQVCDLNKGKQIHWHIITGYNHFTNIVSNALISMYAKTGCINSAHKVFDKMITKDIISYNTMIGAFASHGLGHKALDQVHLMSINGINPDGLTLTNALNACTHCGLVNEGLQLFQNFIKNNKHAKPTMEQYASIVDLLSRAGRFKDVLKLVSEMHVKPNAGLWGAFLSSCGLYNNVEFAKVAFENLVLLEPKNPGNYITMSNIYMSEGRLDEARVVRERIERMDLVKPKGISEVLVNS
ncbi:hypothetical protein LUZ60_005690 [Juncus effusus]|nr:hypothetical protein LUZ60_005690 [Juncus effusus]